MAEPSEKFDKVLLVLNQTGQKERRVVCTNVPKNFTSVAELILILAKQSSFNLDHHESVEYFDDDFQAWVDLTQADQLPKNPKIRVTTTTVGASDSSLSSSGGNSNDAKTNSNAPWQWSPKFLQTDGWVLKGGTDKYKSFLIRGKDGIHDATEFQNLQNLLQSSLGGQDFNIVTAYAIDNDRLCQMFSLMTTTIKSRIERKPEIFNQHSWSNKPDSQWRSQMKQRLDAYCDSFPHNRGSGVKLIPVVHGLSKEESAWSICQTGFASLGWTDSGYFGKGLYFSQHLDYSARCYGRVRPDEDLFMVLVCWVCLSNAYPCCESPFGSESLMGKGSMAGYDSHFSVVKPNDFNDAKCRVYVPSEPHTFYHPKVATEIVVFQEGQVLPRYLVFLQANPSAAKSPPPSPSPIPSGSVITSNMAAMSLNSGAQVQPVPYVVPTISPYPQQAPPPTPLSPLNAGGVVYAPSSPSPYSPQVYPQQQQPYYQTVPPPSSPKVIYYQPTTTPVSPQPLIDPLTRMKNKLLTFEENVLYSAVEEKWREKRPAWVASVRAASDVPSLSVQLRHLETSMKYSAVSENWPKIRNEWLNKVAKAKTTDEFRENLIRLEQNTLWTAVSGTWRILQHEFLYDVPLEVVMPLVQQKMIGFETGVLFSAVADSWRQRRNSWISEVSSSAVTVQHLASLLLEFETAIKYGAVHENWKTLRPSWVQRLQASVRTGDVMRALYQLEDHTLWSAFSESWKTNRAEWHRIPPEAKV